MRVYNRKYEGGGLNIKLCFVGVVGFSGLGEETKYRTGAQM